MSASKVKFAPIDEAGRNDIPTDHAPNAISMAGGVAGADRTAAQLMEIAPRTSGAVDEQFPTDKLTKSSPKDELMTTKLALQGIQVPGPAAAAGALIPGQPAPGVALPAGVTPFGKLIASDEDFKWLQSKRDQEAEANFQQWFATNFDFMSPEQKAAARELFPSFYEQRLKLLDNDLETLRELARIKITGITNRKDLLLTYAAESGYFDINRLNNLLNPEKALQAQNQQIRQIRFGRGLLNPKRLIHSVQPPISNGVADPNNLGLQTRNLNSGGFRDFVQNQPPQAVRLGVTDGFSVPGITYGLEAANNQARGILPLLQ